jgi:hypothetical protein
LKKTPGRGLPARGFSAFEDCLFFRRLRLL